MNITEILVLTKLILFATIALMLMIRLQRIGRKHEPAYRLVLTDSKNSTKSGKFLEILGNYDSRRGEKAEFKPERISYWISQGAKTSDTVHNLLVDKKIISEKKINKLPRKTPVKSEKPEAKSSPMAKFAPVAEISTEESIAEIEIPEAEISAESSIPTEEAVT